MLDVFNSDAFSVVSLTDAINKMKHVPGRLGEMGLFNESGVSDTSVAIEEKSGQLILVAPTARGGPGVTVGKNKRSMKKIAVPHFEINDAVMAEEVQGVRSFGSETQVETVMGKVADRFNLTHIPSHNATEEFSRVGAVTGIITYADGSTLNLYSEFGVSKIAIIDFDLDNASPAEGALRLLCAVVIRTMSTELGGTPFSGAHALCGDNFFDGLLSHKEVRETFKGWTAAQILRDGYVGPNMSVYGQFEFGGIVWENYRGIVDGTTFVDSDSCHIFPVGVPNLFRTYHAPADYVETVNTVGLPRYARQYLMQNNKGVHLDTQMNSLNICTRPRVLLKGDRT